VRIFVSNAVLPTGIDSFRAILAAKMVPIVGFEAIVTWILGKQVFSK
jgi:hypothetical protein